ncbi:hypothetical protein DXZ75_43075 [Streptomyces sp. AcE210]|nr:hypothetical protein DXZ75_43075 [Streptomyces sp. AcE210]
MAGTLRQSPALSCGFVSLFDNVYVIIQWIVERRTGDRAFLFLSRSRIDEDRGSMTTGVDERRTTVCAH